jgi:hypothetical protein
VQSRGQTEVAGEQRTRLLEQGADVECHGRRVITLLSTR